VGGSHCGENIRAKVRGNAGWEGNLCSVGVAGLIPVGQVSGPLSGSCKPRGKFCPFIRPIPCFFSSAGKKIPIPICDSLTLSLNPMLHETI
jgi:hypothetical protein